MSADSVTSRSASASGLPCSVQRSAARRGARSRIRAAARASTRLRSSAEARRQVSKPRAADAAAASTCSASASGTAPTTCSVAGSIRGRWPPPASSSQRPSMYRRACRGMGRGAWRVGRVCGRGAARRGTDASEARRAGPIPFAQAPGGVFTRPKLPAHERRAARGPPADRARTGRHVVVAGDDERPRHACALAARLAPALRTAVARPLLRPRAPRHAARDAPGAGALQCRGAADGLLPRRTPRFRDGAGSRGARHLQRPAGGPRRDHARPARLARPVHAGAARADRRGRRRRAAGAVVAAPLRQAPLGVDGVAAGRAGEGGAGAVPARAAPARARTGHRAPGRARSGRRQRRDRPATARWLADRVAGGAARLPRPWRASAWSTARAS